MGVRMKALVTTRYFLLVLAFSSLFTAGRFNARASGEVQLLDKELRKVHDDKIDTYLANLKLAYSFLLKGKYQNSKYHYALALEKRPNSFFANLGLMDSYSYLGENEKAISGYKEMIVQYPYRSESYLHLAKFYNYLGHYSLAVSLIENALTIFPNHPELMKILIKSYAKLGKVNRNEKVYTGLFNRE